MSFRVASDLKSDTLRTGPIVKLDDLPSFASNTAAIAGGLKTGDVYRVTVSPGVSSTLAVVY